MKKAEHIPPIASFLSRGHDVVLPKDTLMEIGFGLPTLRPRRESRNKAIHLPERCVPEVFPIKAGDY